MSFIPLYARYSEAPAGFEDSDFSLFQEVTLPGVGNKVEIIKAIPNDADFYMRGWEATFVGSGGGKVTIELKDAYGNELLNRKSFAEMILGSDGTGEQAPVFPELYFPRGSTFRIIVTEYL